MDLFETVNRIKVLMAIPLHEGLIGEMDYDKDFPDVNRTCLSPEQLAIDLNKELDRLNNNHNNQKHAITRSSDSIIFGKKGLEKLSDMDIEKMIQNLIMNLTKEPDEIFNHNPKSEHSDVGRPQMTLNTGIPAIVGLVYDVEHNKFDKVSTCPGAGSCVVGCYARKAFYGMSDEKIMKLTRRLNLLLNNPERYKQKILDELEIYAIKCRQMSVGIEPIQLLIRWNDAGDFFTKKYVDIATEVTKELLAKGYNVKSYAYTKIGKYVIELNENDNFVVTFSTNANKKEVGVVSDYDVNNDVKKSEWLPKEVFQEFLLMKGPHYEVGIKGLPLFINDDSPELLKDRIYDLYHEEFAITRDSIKYTWEIPIEKTNQKGKYNVIVLPTGDSDIGAQREDVKVSFLCVH